MPPWMLKQISGSTFQPLMMRPSVVMVAIVLKTGEIYSGLLPLRIRFRVDAMSDVTPAKARKPRDKGPRHVLELPLTSTESDRHLLERRFAAANTLRNGVLQHALLALDACRVDPAWVAARLLKRDSKVEKAARGAAFLLVRERHGLTETALCAVEKTMREGCWIADHMTARLGHVVVKEVLKAVEGHMFLGRGRPAFRRLDDCRSISARQDSPMKLRVTANDGVRLSWSGLWLRVRREEFSPSEMHSLGCDIVHCRVVRVASGYVAPRSPWRYALQVVVKGAPFVSRFRATSGIAGIDTGPAMVGVVFCDAEGDPEPMLIPLAAQVERDEAEIRLSSRRLDRQRRIANPHCFDYRGRWIRGQRIRHQSKRHRSEMASRRRREAKAARHRANCHGRDTNAILMHAAEVRYEGHGFSGWTALWGRAMGRGAPGMFVSELVRKCVDAGGMAVVINHWKAALSQTDHFDGVRTKKPLRQRFHALSDGSGFVQRDVYSAFLASHCDAAGTIDLDGAGRHWERLCEGVVRPTGTLASVEVEAARASALRKPRAPALAGARRSGSNGSRAVPVTRESRRRAWLRDRIAIRRARGTAGTALADSS